MRKLYATLLLLAALAMPRSLQANNVVITGTAFNDATDVLSFTLSWQNSWRISAGPANWDAVWVFIKYQNCPSLVWNHLTLAPAGHSTSAPALLQVQTVSDNVGVFVRRANTGSGDIAATTISLQTPNTAGNGNWNYRVFGIEMVYVPQGDFQIGDGVSTATMNSITITSDGALAAGTLYGSSPAIPAAYPLGWDGFYIMKYDVSNEMYTNFLNTLTYDQQATRTTCNPNDPVGTHANNASIRSRIEISQLGVNNTTPAVYANDLNNNNNFNENNDGQWISLSGNSWDDMLAFLDWSGLRPMSELEYEKACRGTLARVAGEYAWGNTTVTASRPFPEGTNLATANETNNATVVGPLNHFSGQGPWRNGFAATASTNRTTAGASYYGVMEMSGNLWKLVVATLSGGQNFVPNHGDGELTGAGMADVANWPTANNTFGWRGGAHNTAATACRVSDRSSIQPNVASNARNNTYGIRGVRTYP